MKPTTQPLAQAANRGQNATGREFQGSWKALWMLAAAICVSASLLGQGLAQYRNVELVRVVDGDTVRVSVELEPGLWRKDQSCRLLRVDAPERGTQEGKAAAGALTEFLSAKQLRVEPHGRDRWGRWLVEIWADDENVSDWLLEHGHARDFSLDRKKKKR